MSLRLSRIVLLWSFVVLTCSLVINFCEGVGLENWGIREVVAECDKGIPSTAKLQFHTITSRFRKSRKHPYYKVQQTRYVQQVISKIRNSRIISLKFDSLEAPKSKTPPMSRGGEVPTPVTTVSTHTHTKNVSHVRIFIQQASILFAIFVHS